MTNEKRTPGPPRRRFPGEPMVKRKISLTPAELQELEVRAARSNTTVSALLVTTALSPDRGMSGAEKDQLMAALNETRQVLCSLVVAVKNDERSAAIDEYMRSAKAASDRIYNAVEHLGRG